jgi:outer membrane receptor for monomeric catechols
LQSDTKGLYFEWIGGDEQMKTRGVKVGVAVLCANALLLVICQATEGTGKAGSVSNVTVAASTSASQIVQPRSAQTLVAAKTGTNVFTGSYIPGATKKAGQITDGPYNLKVIDRTEIENSGAASVAQILARQPGIKVSGRNP